MWPRWFFHLQVSACLALGSAAWTAQAHQPGVSLLTLNAGESRISGHLELSLADLDTAINLDADGNGSITHEEYLAKQPAIAAYLLGHFRLLQGPSELDITLTHQELDWHEDGVFSRVHFQAALQSAAPLQVEYRLFFHFDPQHRALLHLAQENQESLAVFRPGNAIQIFELARNRPLPLRIRDFVREGLYHIFLGFDHLLFLVALLLPAVLRRVDGAWQSVPHFKPAFIQVVAIVTAFTVAHSVTLSLAVLGYVRLPERWVEPVIAGSVLIAAANNLHPLFHRRAWMVAFGFGLVHGFGFAHVLLDLNLPPATLALALFSFNAGVELGQLLVVCILMPLIYSWRNSFFYQRVTLTAASCLIILLAAGWMLERIFDLQIFTV
jgi:hypothetical protein